MSGKGGGATKKKDWGLGEPVKQIAQKKGVGYKRGVIWWGGGEIFRLFNGIVAKRGLPMTPTQNSKGKSRWGPNRERTLTDETRKKKNRKDLQLRKCWN